jgi:outer membrane protein W
MQAEPEEAEIQAQADDEMHKFLMTVSRKPEPEPEPEPAQDQAWLAFARRLQDPLPDFRNILQHLGNPQFLAEAQRAFAELQQQRTHLQGHPEFIIRIAAAKLFPDEKHRSEFARAVAMKMEQENEFLDIYKGITTKLGVHIVVGIPFLSREPNPDGTEALSLTSDEMLALLDFVPRARGKGFGNNPGLVDDRHRYLEFLKGTHFAICNSSIDEQINISTRSHEDQSLKSAAQIKSVFGFANYSCLPQHSEIVLYYAGHGHTKTGDWIAYDDNCKLVPFSFEDAMEAWISQKQARDNYLTIVADCCFSGYWVDKLKSSTKYHDYPIAIQAACSSNEVAFENVLVPLLCGDNLEKLPQSPFFFRTPARERLHSKLRFVELQRHAPPSRRGLSKCESQKLRKAFLKIIAKYSDGLVNTHATSGKSALVEGDIESARLDLQGFFSLGDRRFAKLQLQHGKKSYACLVVQVDGPGGGVKADNVREGLLWSLQHTSVCYRYFEDSGELTASVKQPFNNERNAKPRDLSHNQQGESQLPEMGLEEDEDHEEKLEYKWSTKQSLPLSFHKTEMQAEPEEAEIQAQADDEMHKFLMTVSRKPEPEPEPEPAQDQAWLAFARRLQDPLPDFRNILQHLGNPQFLAEAQRAFAELQQQRTHLQGHPEFIIRIAAAKLFPDEKHRSEFARAVAMKLEQENEFLDIYKGITTKLGVRVVSSQFHDVVDVCLVDKVENVFDLIMANKLSKKDKIVARFANVQPLEVQLRDGKLTHTFGDKSVSETRPYPFLKQLARLYGYPLTRYSTNTIIFNSTFSAPII